MIFLLTDETSAGTDVQTLKVPLAYGPKQKFMVRLDADPNLDQKVAITLPRIGFEIAGLDYDPSRKLNRIMKRKKVSPDADKKLKQMNTQYSPVPYNLAFELFVMTKNSQMMVFRLLNRYYHFSNQNIQLLLMKYQKWMWYEMFL